MAHMVLAAGRIANTAEPQKDPWAAILEATGMHRTAKVIIARSGDGQTGTALAIEADEGACVVLEGQSEAALHLGFRPTGQSFVARSVLDHRHPDLSIVWEKPERLPVSEVPKEATIFAIERWSKAPLVAGMKRGRGSILWVATSPGPRGFERYPYLPQALADLGLDPPARSARLWAFFDSSYRSRVDLDYFAARWRESGISALHVAAWHYNEPDATRDQYLSELIAACHRNAILVFAWIELPHVSEQFWNKHPEWREKTALQQDAHLDWRKLMNLQNRECVKAIAAETRALIERFDWDGVNLGELYFESLEGAANPARFTPMNDDVRRMYKAAKGIDPLTLFQSPQAAAGMDDFLAFRAELARKMQNEWINQVDLIRATKKDLALVLTHVDDRYDTRMRDLIGADAAKLLPMLNTKDFTFLIEDPATIWHLGPERYPQIAAKYEPLTKHTDKLAIDINIVERYQDVYPTKQQTGTELFQLVNLASRAFAQVALYFEFSILGPDIHLLNAAGAALDRYERDGARIHMSASQSIGVHWKGPARVDGRLWPVWDGNTVWLPPGEHTIEPTDAKPPMRMVDFNGNLRYAGSTARGIEFSYQSGTRAIARFEKPPIRIVLDGKLQRLSPEPATAFLFPKGEHRVYVE